MTCSRSLVALAVMAAFASVAVAQATAPAARNDVKAGAKAAVMSGKTAEGELRDGGASAPTTMSDKPRSEVKAEAKAAVKSSETAEGPKGASSSSDPAAKTSTTASRSDVKSDAKAAVKVGATAEGEKGGSAYGSQNKATKAKN